jgi:eukaryotic-like serine/threonine-protein kinase
MSTAKEPGLGPQPRTGREGAILIWLDSLSIGLCTPEAFLAAMHEQFRDDQDESWEVLSLLDQYYRRGKIKPELFHQLKSHLVGSALNANEDAAASVRSHATTNVTTPISASRETAPPDPRPPDPRPAVREVAIGDVLRDRYRLRAVLGRGGLGIVFEAADEYRLDVPRAGQRVAIKVLHTALAKRQDMITGLQMQFQQLQSLSHPNIVRVHEFDRDGDIAFFTMELLSGAVLSRVLGARNAIALPRPQALAVIRDIGAALCYAHSRGVIHGDLNPQNVFVANDGDLRVMDFAASRTMLHEMWPADVELSRRHPVAARSYASCQVLEGQRADARDDLFALACIAYELLSGKHPFPKRTAVEASAARVRPRRPPGLAGHQWRALREGLRWDRDRRPADLRQWLNRFDLRGAAARLPALPELVKTPVARKRTLGRAAAAVMILALLAAAGYWALADYDSLASRVAAWTRQARSALDTAGSLPAAPEPALAQQTPPPPAPPITHAAPAAPPPVPMAVAPAAAPTAASSMTAAPPILTSRRGAAAAAPASSGESSPHAANAGPIRIEMAADTVDVQAAETTAHVIVRRRGSLHGAADFTWWTESGTAKPGKDFTPVIPHVEHFEDGSGSVTLSVPVSSTPRTQAKSFYIVIDRTDTGAALGARNLTMVTLQPPPD